MVPRLLLVCAYTAVHAIEAPRDLSPTPTTEVVPLWPGQAHVSATPQTRTPAPPAGLSCQTNPTANGSVSLVVRACALKVVPFPKEEEEEDNPVDWLVVLLIAAAVVLALGLVAVAVRRREQRTVSFDAATVQQVEVVLRAGAVTFTVGDDSTVRVHRTTRWALAKPVTSERVDDGVLRIEAVAQRPWHLGGDVEYLVELPASTSSVRASTGTGALSVTEVSSDVALQTGAGQVTLTRVGGSLTAATRAGTISGDGLACHELDVETNAGSIALSFDVPPSRVNARTNAGGIELTVPAERYAVEATVHTGQVEVGVPNDPSAERRLVVHSNAGAVHVRLH
jgi:NADH:ubiquinone oxidoreductase subunit K